LESIVTAPFRASALPSTIVAFVFSVMLVSATILPVNSVRVPSVAELPTCHQTFAALAPLISVTEESVAVVRVLPI
jgi:hypothetical protein